MSILLMMEGSHYHHNHHHHRRKKGSIWCSQSVVVVMTMTIMSIMIDLVEGQPFAIIADTKLMYIFTPLTTTTHGFFFFQCAL